MWVVNDDGCSRMDDEWISEAMDVFSGELTCCRLKHSAVGQHASTGEQRAGMGECDRQKLVLPFLAMHGQVL